MNIIVDITKKRFGRLIVIGRVDNDCSGHACWLCMCNCGQQTIVRGSSLKGGYVQSCGCLQKEITSIIKTKHGHKRNGKSSRTYKTWNAMIQRCINLKNSRYDHYGGRGIIVCRRWKKFENFLEDMGESPKDHQIDRIDNDGNYCKSNCRWATPKQNSRNRRNNHLETFDGQTKCIMEWAEEYGIKYETLCSRIDTYGWSIEKALTTPVRELLTSKSTGR